MNTSNKSSQNSALKMLDLDEMIKNAMKARDTNRLKAYKNIKAKKAFTISFADADHVAACDYVGIASGNNTADKMEKAGFTTEKSKFVDAPVINELPLTLECSFVRVTEEGNIIGRIVNISAADSILGDDGQIDLTKFRPISFDPVHNGYHVLGEKVGAAFSDGKELM